MSLGKDRTSRIDLGVAHQAGLLELTKQAKCYICGEAIGEYAYFYQWAHRAKDDKYVSNLLIFCSGKCLQKWLREDVLPSEDVE